MDALKAEKRVVGVAEEDAEIEYGGDSWSYIASLNGSRRKKR